MTKNSPNKLFCDAINTVTMRDRLKQTRAARLADLRSNPFFTSCPSRISHSTPIHLPLLLSFSPFPTGSQHEAKDLGRLAPYSEPLLQTI